MGAEKRSRARRAASIGDRRNGWHPEVSGASHRLDGAVGAESVTLCHRSAAGARAPGLRIVLCSHDTMGLGHMRRTLLISRALAGSQLQANILMIAGAAEAKLFHMPARVDCVTLPALRKQSDGRYEARSLGLTLPEIGSLRASTICAAVEAFSPDVMIVDNLPWGAPLPPYPMPQGVRRRGRG